jgi:hypothetical protein
MDSDTLLKRVAPCGLVCYTCAAAKDGIIQQHGRELTKHLEGFEPYAEMMSAYDKRLKKYPEFKEVLQLIGEANCEGCRDGQCKFPGCGIAPCIKEKGYDFCFECPSFPCEEADFEPLLKAKWLKANERMKEIGAEAYFEEVRDRSHYE